MEIVWGGGRGRREGERKREEQERKGRESREERRGEGKGRGESGGRERMVFSSPVEPRENPPRHKDHSRMTEERKKVTETSDPSLAIYTQP